MEGGQLKRGGGRETPQKRGIGRETTEERGWKGDKKRKIRREKLNRGGGSETKKRERKGDN